jgi:hypothetical protein
MLGNSIQQQAPGFDAFEFLGPTGFDNFYYLSRTRTPEMNSRSRTISPFSQRSSDAPMERTPTRTRIRRATTSPIWSSKRLRTNGGSGKNRSPICDQPMASSPITTKTSNRRATFHSHDQAGFLVRSRRKQYSRIRNPRRGLVLLLGVVQVVLKCVA